MLFACAQCGETIEATARPTEVIECPHCNAKLKPPMKLQKANPVSDTKPVILPVVLPTRESPELAEEKVKDLQETRKQRGDDRASNGIAGFGFAVGLATLLFLFSAAAVSGTPSRMNV